MKASTLALLDAMTAETPALEGLKKEIGEAAELLIGCFSSGGRLYVCGCGGSAADSETSRGGIGKSFPSAPPSFRRGKGALSASLSRGRGSDRTYAGRSARTFSRFRLRRIERHRKRSGRRICLFSTGGGLCAQRRRVALLLHVGQFPSRRQRRENGPFSGRARRGAYGEGRRKAGGGVRHIAGGARNGNVPRATAAYAFVSCSLRGRRGGIFRKMIAGLDIGGTKCAVVLGKEREAECPELVYRKEIPTRGSSGDILAALTEELKKQCPLSEIEGVGISCGGPLDAETGDCPFASQSARLERGSRYKARDRKDGRALLSSKRRRRLRAGGMEIRGGQGSVERDFSHFWDGAGRGVDPGRKAVYRRLRVARAKRGTCGWKSSGPWVTARRAPSRAFAAAAGSRSMFPRALWKRGRGEKRSIFPGNAECRAPRIWARRRKRGVSRRGAFGRKSGNTSAAGWRSCAIFSIPSVSWRAASICAAENGCKRASGVRWKRKRFVPFPVAPAQLGGKDRGRRSAHRRGLRACTREEIKAGKYENRTKFLDFFMKARYNGRVERKARFRMGLRARIFSRAEALFYRSGKTFDTVFGRCRRSFFIGFYAGGSRLCFRLRVGPYGGLSLFLSSVWRLSSKAAIFLWTPRAGLRRFRGFPASSSAPRSSVLPPPCPS